jgi:hypothetical protein
MTYNLLPREQFVLDNADHFVAVRGRGLNRTRNTFKTIKEAESFGRTYGDKRTMIYAVAGDDTPAIGGVSHITNA